MQNEPNFLEWNQHLATPALAAPAVTGGRNKGEPAGAGAPAANRRGHFRIIDLPAGSIRPGKQPLSTAGNLPGQNWQRRRPEWARARSGCCYEPSGYESTASIRQHKLRPLPTAPTMAGQTGQSDEIHSPEAWTSIVVSLSKPVSRSMVVAATDRNDS